MLFKTFKFVPVCEHVVGKVNINYTCTVRNSYFNFILIASQNLKFKFMASIK